MAAAIGQYSDVSDDVDEECELFEDVVKDLEGKSAKVSEFQLTL